MSLFACSRHLYGFVFSLQDKYHVSSEKVKWLVASGRVEGFATIQRDLVDVYYTRAVTRAVIAILMALFYHCCRGNAALPEGALRTSGLPVC